VLRLDYPIGGGCPAALIEPSAQNLAWHSETWATGTNWTLTNTTTVTGTSGTLDPLGTNTANAISPTTASGSHIFQSNSPTTITFTSGTIYTQSAFFKQGTGDAGRYVQLSNFSTRFTQLGYANFDLELGTVTVVSGSSADSNRAASIENYGNGWYRCRLTSTCDSSGAGTGIRGSLITASGDIRTPSFTGVTGDVLYGWGAQLETGAIPTSYIPTTTGSATRNADVCTVSGVSGYIGQTEGTIYVEAFIPKINAAYVVGISNGLSVSNAVYLQVRPNFSLEVFIRSAGSTVGMNFAAANWTAGLNKVAFTYGAGSCSLVVNGSSPVTGTVTNVPTCNTVTLGSNTSILGNNSITDRIRAVALYTTRLTDDQLQSLTRLT